MSVSGLNILLAEDNPTNQLVAVQMLESLGATVTLAHDGAEALEILQDRAFDVALIDIEMPRLSGIDLLRTLRADPGTNATMPMIALTAYVMREHRVAIGEAGADGIIAKPILSIERFGEEIMEHVQARHTLNAKDGTTEDRPSDEPQSDNATDDTESAGIDHEIFDRLCASFDDETLKELFVRIHGDISGAADRIYASMQQSETVELRAATHILISVAGAIGATRLQSLAQCLNSAGHASDIAAIDRDAPKLLAEAERVLDFVGGSKGG
ncbi:MAG: response regulator [Pseudomonadota bacterium]